MRKILSFNKLYLIYIFLLGIIFVFSVPPMIKHDEHTHFKRVVSIAEGQFFCKNNEQLSVPSKYINFADTLAIGQKLPKDQYSYNFSNFQNNNRESFDGCGLFFLGYIPNTIGFLLGTLISASNPLVGFYLSRLSGFLFFLIFFYLSIKKINDKVMKTILIVICCIPMLLNQAATVGYDGTLIAFSIILFSYLTNLLSSDVKLNKKNKIILFLLLICTISIKPVAYFPFVFVYFLIPYKKIANSLKEYILFSSVFFGLLAIYYVIYLKFGIYNHLTSDPSTIQFYNTHFQRLLIRKDPLYFAKVLLDSVHLNLLGYSDSMIANYYFGTTLITRTLYYSIFGALAVYVILSAKKSSLKSNQLGILFLFLSILGIFSLISFSLYSEFSELASINISGVQGRYFLPVVTFLYLLLFLINKKYNYKKTMYIIFFLVLSIITWDTFSTLHTGVIQRNNFVSEKSMLSLKNKIENLDQKAEYFSILDKNNYIINTSGDVLGLIIFHKNENNLYKVPQKWQIKDSECNKVLRSGYLQINQLIDNEYYELKFKKLAVNDKGLCFVITPLEIFYGENYLEIGHVNNEPLILPIVIPSTSLMINDFGLFYNNSNIGEIWEDTKFTQTFLSEDNNLVGVELFVATYGVIPNVEYDFVLMDEFCSKEIRRVIVDFSNAKDLGFYEIYFDKIEESKNNKYCFALRTNEIIKKDLKPITLETSKDNIYMNGDLTLDQKQVDNDLIFRTINEVEN